MPKHSCSKILIVDDNAANIELVEIMLRMSGYTNLCTTMDPEAVDGLIRELDPDLVILDLHMPKKDGMQVLAEIRATTPPDDYLPVLVFTADGYATTRNKALEAGANDFLQKPGDFTEIILRVGNFLEMRAMHCRLRDQARVLEAVLEERTDELEHARLEVLHKLQMAHELRDDGTGDHPYRVAQIAAEIGAAMGLPKDVVEMLRLATPLHDVGKIGIPDSMLLKTDKLTANEFELLKIHVEMGAKILGNSKSPLLRAAEEIARCHHENWDGTGYPAGLAGEDIPLLARIVSVADTYDALVSVRPYKPAWSQQDAMQAISGLEGRKFDPKVVEAFRSLFGESAESLPQAA